MKQVIQSTRTGKLALKEVPEPKVRAGHVLVLTRASLISAGTERLLVQFARKSLAGKARARPDLVKKVLAKAKRDGLKATARTVKARLDEPLALGYSAAGEIAAVGAGLEGAFHVGQRVAIAGAGLANHAEINVVPANLAASVADNVPFEEACFATLGAIALHAVRNINPGLGDVVAVIGAGLVGQMAAQLLALSGARVLVLDYDCERLELATRLGAEAAFDLNQDGLNEAVAALTSGRGCDGVLIAAATESSEPFETAAAVARDRARVCMVGMTGTAFPYREFMGKELSLVVSRSYGPGRHDADFEGRGMKYPEGWVPWTETGNLAECLRLMSLNGAQRLDVAALTTHRFPIDQAEDAFALISGGKTAHLGVVLTYGEQAEAAPGPAFPAAKKPSPGGCVLGVVGGGNFARAVLLPELKKLKGVDLHTIVTLGGAKADHGRQAFGFVHAASEAAAVLDNPDINAVLIATRHDSHAGLAAQALEAGKAVLVEKPLALSRHEINQVIAARNASGAFFQVGFNRRFAPLAIEVRDRLAKAPGANFVLLRINAGALAPESWIHHPEEGGGRILGEMCHFVDLARFLIGAPIASVQAEAAAFSSGTCDDVTAVLRFKDGSLATVAYTGLGDSAYPKELIEAYAGGQVITVEDFRTLKSAGGGNLKSRSARTQDKGFRAALAAFANAVANGGPAPVDEGELVETSIATIAVMESLQSGMRIDL